MKRIKWIFATSILAAAVTGEASAQTGRQAGSGTAPSITTTDRAQEDPLSLGQPLSYWLKSIRERDPETIETAFDAIVDLGPEAWRAVPELTKIVAEPFVPIRVDKDSLKDIHSKVFDIQLRAGAVDGLGAIGEAAASSAGPVIRWGLTVRVLPSETRSPADAILIELIGIDVLERMRVAGAVARFGPGATQAVEELLRSPDVEKRKLFAAILNDVTVPIATDLMSSKSCEERMLGLSLLSAMWPVVDKGHLITLQGMLQCSRDEAELPSTLTVTGGRPLLE
jgi:hypothetical protein